MTQVCVCALIQHPNNKELFLSVSRKDNPDQKGIPGGKYEWSDLSYEWALEREVEEETGLKVYVHTSEMYADMDQDNIVLTYICKLHYKNNPNDFKTEESGLVEWVTIDKLFNKPFGEYNKKMYKFLKGFLI